MTRTHPSFPIAFRVAATVLALAALLAFAVVPGAASPRDKLEEARKERAAIQDRVENARAEYDRISGELAVKSQAVEEAEAALEGITAELMSTRAQLDAATEKLARVQASLNERAAQAYMQGPGSSLEFLLGSASLAELSDRMEFVGAVAQSDEDLAQSVHNTQNELTASKETLEGLQSKARRQEAAAQDAKDEVLALFSQQQSLLSQIETDLRDAQQQVGKADKAYEAWLKAQQAEGYGGGHSSVPMPDGWADTFERCPVDGPRTYGDGFGAPRYAGGYHLHKGVDILAPMGTPIVATYDGYARQDYNSLGGNVVFVSGKYGETYNAHLSAFSSNSTGPVQAGT